MYDYIHGTLVELNPAEAVVECHGIGYKMLISLQTYSALEPLSGGEAKIYVHHYHHDDDESFFGFFTKEERSMFQLLIGVSGIGPNTARMMLSSMTCDEMTTAIVGQDVTKIKSIKGIGVKTAQRLILELKDKVIKGSSAQKEFALAAAVSSPAREEATSALILLGFAKASVDKALDSVLKKNPGASLEQLIKDCLKIL